MVVFIPAIKAAFFIFMNVANLTKANICRQDLKDLETIINTCNSDVERDKLDRILYSVKHTSSISVSEEVEIFAKIVKAKAKEKIEELHKIVAGL